MNFVSKGFRKNLANMKAEMKEKNTDWLHINSGSPNKGRGEGTGKSAFALAIAQELDDNFSVADQVAFDGKEFRRKAVKLEPFKPIIWDEGVEGLYSREAMTKQNKANIKFLRKCRDLNLFMIINMPDITELEKPIRNNRAQSAARCVKQGWAWLYGNQSLNSIRKDKNESIIWPTPDLKTGWPDPEKAFPEIWNNYKNRKMQDLEELGTDIEDDTKWVSVGVFSDRVGVHPDTVRSWCDKGKVSSGKLPNGDRRIPEDEIKRIVNNPVSPNAN